MASCSKDFLLEFIELFKTQEPLWLIKSKDYYNKGKRNACYDLLLEKVLTIDQTANRDTITKKINNLRSAFRKESGASADEIYTPKLWYYRELLFLKDQEEPLPSTSSIDVCVEIDFSVLYPDKVNRFKDYWKLFMKNLIELKKEEIQSEENKKNEFMSLCSLDTEDQKLSMELTILINIVPPKGRVSKTGKFSTQECLDSITSMIIVENPGDINTHHTEAD
ncbi:hypothetical protein ACJJTC_005763 [Scirpophaga incertulas]